MSSVRGVFNMMMRSQYLCVLAPLAMLLVSTGAYADPTGKPQAAARLATYEKPTGENYFALSVSPTSTLPVADAHDIVVMIDTSATQSGAYRTQSLAVLRSTLASLGENDRVQLVAVDTRPVPLSQGFVAPGSDEMKAALAKLDKRAPLGATDLGRAFDYVATAYPADSKAARVTLYLGDGMNKAAYLAGDRFNSVVNKLVDERISVSSCAIGVERNAALLAAVANQTGGNFITSNPGEGTPENAGTALAAIAQTPVAWPQDVKMPAQFAEVYPARMPPLRADRDTILIGVANGDGPAEVTVNAVSGGENMQFQWTPMAEPSNEDFAFLPKLVDLVKPQQGMNLPTVGSEGLREAARFVMTSAEELAELGHKALSSGNVEGAKRVAEEALRRDPNNPKAKALKAMASKGASRTAATAADAATGSEPDLTLVSFADGDREESGLLERFEAEEGRFIDRIEAERAVRAGLIQAQVEEGLRDARQSIAEGDSAGAVQNLKILLDNVERTPDLDAETRADLSGRIASAIREAERRATIDQFIAAETEQRRAQAEETRRILGELQDREQRLVQLMDRFMSLMEESRFHDAERDVVPQVQVLAPSSQLAAGTMWWADFARNIVEMERLVRLRDEMFNDTLYQVELSHVPLPDEPPIIYPSAEKWEDITIRRRKYSSVDLVKPGSAEENIMQELEKETDVDVIELEFGQLMRDLAKRHEITVVLDPEGLEEAGVTTDQLVTLNLKGITLRSALRILLGPLNLTYVVKDEVLQITSEEKAGEQLVTKVYPVGDLVVPIMSGGGMMGGMMGGMGGGMGGMGGGMGGMGGGMGGMGGGMGGMGGGGGGFFDVEDDLKLDGSAKPTDAVKEATVPAQEQPAAASRVRRPQAAASQTIEAIKLDRQAEESLDDAWDRYFAAQAEKLEIARNREALLKQSEAAVRQTVRDMMQAKDYEGTTALIQAALRSGQAQTWMYEALSLAMRAANAPEEGIERALMSGVDLSDDLDSVMLIALYMSKAGLEKSALHLYQQVAAHQPSRPEPYVQGLACAKYLHDRQGIMWACKGILSQAWEREHRHIEREALNQARAMILELEKDNQGELAKKFETELQTAMARDCYVVVSWTGDADIDVAVEEPSGTICSLEKPRSAGGGVILGDSFAQGTATPGGFQEIYTCPEAFAGEYRMLIKRVWGKVTAGKVTVDIYTKYQTKDQKRFRHQIELGEKNAVVVFNLDEGRRKDMLAEEQIANVAKIQNAVGRQVLAQQLGQVEDSSATARYLASLAESRGVDPRYLLAGLGRRGAVGFTIRPTILPEGLTMTAQAVISADRRYVRITPTPMINSIGQVTTFNVASGETNDITGGGGGGGLGGGGGGIGGGGGGLGFGAGS